MADEDILEEGGPEPAPEAPEVDVAPEPEEATYRWSEIAEALPHLDRFAKDHEGLEAVRQYGQSYSNARGLISTGGHMSRQEEDAYRAAGIDPAEVQIPQQEEPQEMATPIYGAPWQPPESWDDFIAYANSENPDQRRVAAFGVLQSDADQPTKQWFFNQWAMADPYGAAAYNQQVMIERTQSEREALKAELMAELAPVQATHTNTYVDGLIAQARAGIPGFSDHEQAIGQLMTEREKRYPGYTASFNGADVKTQLAEFRELTILAAANAKPARKAAQAAAGASTEAAILAARTETSRTNGAPETDADAERRREREQMRRVGARVF